MIKRLSLFRPYAQTVHTGSSFIQTVTGSSRLASSSAATVLRYARRYENVAQKSSADLGIKKAFE